MECKEGSYLRNCSCWGLGWKAILTQTIFLIPTTETLLCTVQILRILWGCRVRDHAKRLALLLALASAGKQLIRALALDPKPETVATMRITHK